MNHPCDGRTDGRTDGQTDGIAIAYARLAYMLSRAKIERINEPSNEHHEVASERYKNWNTVSE